jgi:hypothetical protein
MIFSNPSVIQNIEDAIIGGVNVHTDKVCFMNYGRLVKNRLLKLVVQEVQLSMKQDYPYEDVINDFSKQLYEYLHFDYHLFPRSEEEIVEQMTNSYEYYNWINKIYYSFMNSHKGVITEETPIEVSGKNPNLQDFMQEIESQDIYDVLQALCTEYSIQY